MPLMNAIALYESCLKWIYDMAITAITVEKEIVSVNMTRNLIKNESVMTIFFKSL